MLVLTRKADQKIHIGENITITVVKVKGNSVQLGIDAPEGVRILREELVGGQGCAGKRIPSNQTTASASEDFLGQDVPPGTAIPDGWQDPDFPPSASCTFPLQPTKEAKIGRRLVRVRAFVVRA
jgi:carbon storage regulator